MPPTQTQRTLIQDVGGDENFHLFVQPVAGGPPRDVTPYDGVRVDAYSLDKYHPNEVRARARMFLKLKRGGA